MFEKIKNWFKGVFTKKDKRTPLEKRIDELTERMRNYDEYSDDYTQMANNLAVLTAAQAQYKEATKRWRLDGNVVFNGFMALLQVILILIWEERHVIRSEATRFVTKFIGRK